MIPLHHMALLMGASSQAAASPETLPDPLPIDPRSPGPVQDQASSFWPPRAPDDRVPRKTLNRRLRLRARAARGVA